MRRLRGKLNRLPHETGALQTNAFGRDHIPVP
jgi:hypothetical protein